MARSFPGGAATDRISTSLTANANLRTYFIWAYRIGVGGGSAGRMFAKGTTAATEYLSYVDATGSYDYSRFWTAGASWRSPAPSTNAWHPVLVRYDSSSSANAPLIDIDGTSQTVTPNSTPSGSRTDNAEAFIIGNRATDNGRCWDGWLGEFAVWDRILSDDEAAALAKGFSPRFFPAGLIEYIPLIRDVTSLKLSAPTATGTLATEHPRLIYPVGVTVAVVAAIPLVGTLGLFDSELRTEPWFDESLITESWFDDDLIVTASPNNTVTPAPVTLTLSSFAPKLNQTLTPAKRDLSLTTFAPSVRQGATVTPPAALLALTTFAPQLQARLTPANRMLTLSVFAPTLKQLLVPDSCVLTLSSSAPTIQHGVVPGSRAVVLATFVPMLQAQLTPASRSLIFTAFAPQLRAQATPASRSVTFTTFAPTATQSAVVTLGAASLVLVTFAPSLVVAVIAGSATLSLSTFAPQLAQTITPDSRALILTTYAPALDNNVTAVPLPGSLTLTRFAPSVTNPVTVRPVSGNLVFSTFAPQLGAQLTPVTVTLSLAVFAPSIGSIITPAVGTLSLNTLASQLQVAVTVSAGLLTLARFAPVIIGGFVVGVPRIKPLGVVDVSGEARQAFVSHGHRATVIDAEQRTDDV